MIHKIAILSDIHGNLPALEAVVADMQARRVDTIVNLGDHLSGPLWPRETLEYLIAQDWLHIRGNHERQLVVQNTATEQAPSQYGPAVQSTASDRYAFEQVGQTGLEWLRNLPASLELEGGLLLCHGSPSNDMTYLLETVECGTEHRCGRGRLATLDEIAGRLGECQAQIILCGHTHIPRVVEVRGMLIVNPGSVGLPAYEDTTPEYHVMETGSPHARYAILEVRAGSIRPYWRVELMAVAYDHMWAAEQALKNGRPDWEIALRTGFMEE